MLPFLLGGKRMKVLAISGGVDSMLLLENYKKEEIVVAHVNHGYREESKKEYEMVKRTCEKLRIPFEGIELNLKDRREHHARERRYQFFEEVLKKYNSKELVLGHHADDLLETFIMNVGRKGEGTALIGMSEESEDVMGKGYKIIRPLLKMTKKEIYEEANKKGIEWMEDQSNYSDKDYLRNKVRLNIVPILKEYFPQITESVYQITKENKEKEKIVDELLNKEISEIKKAENVYIINKKEFEEKTDYIKKKIIKKVIKKITKEKTKNNIYLDLMEKINAKELNTDFQKIKKGVWLVNDRNKFYLLGEEIKKQLEEETEEYKKTKKREMKNKKIPKAFRKSIMRTENCIEDIFGNKY